MSLLLPFYAQVQTPHSDEVSNSDIYAAAFHLLAKQIYLALVRLAAAGDEVTSFFFIDDVQIENVDEATAIIFLPEGDILTVDLKSGEEALQTIEKIMKEQILHWARAIASRGSRIYHSHRV